MILHFRIITVQNFNICLYESVDDRYLYQIIPKFISWCLKVLKSVALVRSYYEFS